LPRAEFGIPVSQIHTPDIVPKHVITCFAIEYLEIARVRDFVFPIIS
jgi:hypothetical protein